MRQLARLTAMAALMAFQGAYAANAVPACTAIGTVQALVCGDPELSDDEEMLASAFSDARRRAGTGAAELNAEQRAWLAERERCLVDSLPWDCVRDRTIRRTATLQIRFRLIDPSGHATFSCDPAGNDTLALEFFATGPFTEAAIARRGGQDTLLWITISANGSRYVGPGIEIWLAHDVALVRWGKGAAQKVCRSMPDPAVPPG